MRLVALAVLMSVYACWLVEPGWAGPLHDAAKAGDVGQVQDLLAAGTQVDEPDTATMTALHWAADAGHAEVARVLIAGGADMDATDFTGQSPLHLATYSGHEAVAELLIVEGAGSIKSTPRARRRWTTRPEWV